MKDYKVSVIVPAFNAEKYIRRCLDSLMMQTIDLLEIIVVDDGSTDDTFRICESLSEGHNNIKVISKPNEGQGVARNIGMKLAKGEYIGFVDADDFVDKNMYECLYENARELGCDWAYSYMEGEEYLNSELLEQYEHGIIVSSDLDKKVIKKMFLGGLPSDKYDGFLGMSVCRSIFSTSKIRKNNIEFISERIVNSEDMIFNLDYLDNCERMCTVNAKFYHYCHDNPTSFSVRPNPERYLMFKELYRELLKRTDHTEEILRAQRRFLANTRVIMVEKARWCTVKNYNQMKKEIEEILCDEQLKSVLETYPLKQLPLMQKIYFYFMKYRFAPLLIATAKLRYYFLGR